MSFEYKTSKTDEVQNIFMNDKEWNEELGVLDLAMFSPESLSNKNFFSEMLEAVNNEKQFQNIKFTKEDSNDKELIFLIEFMIKKGK